MTISKAYSLLEAEGVLVRNRGKQMTVAGIARNYRKASAPLNTRLEQIYQLIDQLVVAARQLQLSEAELVHAVQSKWETTDGRNDRPSIASR